MIIRGWNKLVNLEDLSLPFSTLIGPDQIDSS